MNHPAAPPVREDRSRFFAALLLVLVLGGALRFSRLGHESLWNDEIFTVWIVRQPFTAMWRAILDDVHPPLYYLVLRAWTAWFGSGDVSVRACSAALGVLTIAVAGLGLRRSLGVEAAVLGAGILATAPPLVHYSQEARMYALVVLAATLAMVGALGWHYNRTRRWACLYATAAVAAGFTQYYTVLGWATLAAGYAGYLWLGEQQPCALRRWLAWNALPALTFLAWAPVFHAQASRAVGGLWLTALGAPPAGALAEMVSQLGGVYFTGQVFRIAGSATPWLLRGAVTAGAVLGTAVLLPTRRTAALPPDRTPSCRGAVVILTAAGVIPLVVIWLFSQYRNIWLFRGLLFTTPAVSGLLALGLVLIPGRRWRALIAGVLLATAGVGSYANRGSYHREAWRETAGILLRERRPGDALLVTAPFVARDLTHYGIDPAWIVPVPAQLDDGSSRAAVEAHLRAAKRTWVVISHAPGGRLPSLLEDELGWRRTREMAPVGVRLLLFEPPAVKPASPVSR